MVDVDLTDEGRTDACYSYRAIDWLRYDRNPVKTQFIRCTSRLQGRCYCLRCRN